MGGGLVRKNACEFTTPPPPMLHAYLTRTSHLTHNSHLPHTAVNFYALHAGFVLCLITWTRCQQLLRLQLLHHTPTRAVTVEWGMMQQQQRRQPRQMQLVWSLRL